MKMKRRDMKKAHIFLEDPCHYNKMGEAMEELEYETIGVKLPM